MRHPADREGKAVPFANRRGAAILLLAVVAVSLPVWAPGAIVDVLSIALLYGFLAAAWNIVGGFAGLISVGHAAFFGLGAYGVAVCYVNLGMSPILAFWWELSQLWRRPICWASFLSGFLSPVTISCC